MATLCLLCGATIHDEVDYETWMPRQGWVSQFRALYTVLAQWDTARLSGVGERRPGSDIIPFDQSARQAVMNLDLIASNVQGDYIRILISPTHFGEPNPRLPPTAQQPLWGYALHAGCWSLLEMNYPRLQSEPAACVQALFDLCRSCPISAGAIDWGHDYGGLFRRKFNPHELLPGEDNGLQRSYIRGEVARSNPFHIPELPTPNECSDTSRSLQIGHQHHYRTPSSANRGVDPFQQLPLEISTEILTLLPSVDAAALRLASRVFASAPLTNSFWRSRFYLGREFSYLYEYASLKHVPARGLIDIVKSIQDLPAVINRRRVWSLASSLANLIDAKLGSSRCDRSYVSGFRWIQHDGEVLRLGYNQAKREAKILWPEDTPRAISVSEIEVALDTRGIRALRFLTSGGRFSNWVGDHEGNLKTRLIASNADDQLPGIIKTLKAGFDALKLVSLSISVDGAQENVNFDSEGNERPRVWHPHLPARSIGSLGADSRLIAYRNVLTPFSACLFGGEDGKLLPYLTHLTLWTAESPHDALWENKYPWGLVFHYDHPDDNFMTNVLGIVPSPGRSRVQEHNFKISSAEGERIIRIDVHYVIHKCPAAITIYTNRMREARLPAGVLEDIPKDNFWTEPLKRNVVLQNLGILYTADSGSRP
ncbi:hypothetical protein HJFPF1_10153 [Paramyrothecium foliicola]|nr:hypothetical protein HJFPF1_10153 [Paramyrothecium foliicola]